MAASSTQINHELFLQGKLCLFGDINDDNVVPIIQQLKLSDSEKIYLFIQTDGGYLETACALIDEIEAVKESGREVDIIAQGCASSAGAIILAFGSSSFATPNSYIMMHPCSYSLGDDEYQKHQRAVDFCTRNFNILMERTAKNCGYKTKKDFALFMEEIKDGLWMTPEEAIDFGIINGIWRGFK